MIKVILHKQCYKTNESVVFVNQFFIFKLEIGPLSSLNHGVQLDRIDNYISLIDKNRKITMPSLFS